MRLALAAFLIACTLCSCGDNGVDPEAPRIMAAQVIAVTLPESLVAGATVPVLVHWFPRDCAEEIERMSPVLDGPRHWTISPRGVAPGGIIICTDELWCGAAFDTLDITVPAAGTDHYTLSGAFGAFDFDVAAGVGADGPGHRLTLVDPSGAPRVNQQVRYLDRWQAGGVILDSTITDSAGTARAAPPPCSEGEIDMYVDQFCGSGTLRFYPLCGRALRTVMLYVRAPVFTTGTEETAAMYSGGKP